MMSYSMIFWTFIHKCFCEPLEGLWTLLTLGKLPPDWMLRLTEWTMAKAYGIY